MAIPYPERTSSGGGIMRPAKESKPQAAAPKCDAQHDHRHASDKDIEPNATESSDRTDSNLGALNSGDASRSSSGGQDLQDSQLRAAGRLGFRDMLEESMRREGAYAEQTPFDRWQHSRDEFYVRYSGQYSKGASDQNQRDRSR